MQITERRDADVLILELSGGMTIGHGDTEVGDAIRAALTAGESKILLDIGDVPMVDSFGIGELVSAYSSATRRNAALKLLKPAPRVQDVLEISGLGGLFETFEDETTAVASFG